MSLFLSSLRLTPPIPGIAKGLKVNMTKLNQVHRQTAMGKTMSRIGNINGTPTVDESGSRTLMEALSDLSAMVEDMSKRGVGEVVKDKFRQAKAGSDGKEMRNMYIKAREIMMEPKVWTYAAYRNYQTTLLELAGGKGWRAKLSEKSASVQQLENTLKVLDAMTPIELMSNHHSVFSVLSKKLIAEKAGVTFEFVDQVLLEHDALRADRRWFMIRKQFGQLLPESQEDRELWAPADRLFGELEREKYKKIKEQRGNREHNKRGPMLKGYVWRYHSTGADRWRQRPPRWFPHWPKVRPGKHMVVR